MESVARYSEIFNVKDVAFFDDAFLVGKDYVVRLLKELSNLKLRFHLPNGIHARLVDEEIAHLLKEANFKTIKLGYETSGELQKKTGGKVFDDDLLRAVENLKRAGFTKEELSAYVMINMPGQRKEDVLRAIELCRSLDIGINLNEYTPIPGTKDWNELVEKGLIDPGVDPLLLNNTILPFWWRGGMSVEEVEKVKEVLKRIRDS